MLFCAWVDCGFLIFGRLRLGSVDEDLGSAGRGNGDWESGDGEELVSGAGGGSESGPGDDEDLVSVDDGDTDLANGYGAFVEANGVLAPCTLCLSAFDGLTGDMGLRISSFLHFDPLPATMAPQ